MKTLVLSAMSLEVSKIKVLLAKKYYKDNVTVLSTGMGKVASVSALQKYLLESADNIDTIVLIGFAGGLNKTYKKGDLVSINKSFQHDFGIIRDGQMLRQRPGFIDIENKKNKDIMYKLMPLQDVFGKTIHYGTIATGDIFANDTCFKDNLAKEADLVDMETGAITQFLKKYYPDIKLYSIRIVSDSASDSAEKEVFKSLEQMLKALTNGAEKILDWLYR